MWVKKRYKNEWLIERGIHRLKGTPLSLNPLFVKRDDRVAGITSLLSVIVQVFTVIEFVARRKLKQNQEKLVGLFENNPKKGIDTPTTECLLGQFSELALTIVCLPVQTIRHVTRLSDLQIHILELVGLSPMFNCSWPLINICRFIFQRMNSNRMSIVSLFTPHLLSR
jgi:transposase